MNRQNATHEQTLADYWAHHAQVNRDLASATGREDYRAYAVACQEHAARCAHLARVALGLEPLICL